MRDKSLSIDFLVSRCDAANTNTLENNKVKETIKLGKNILKKNDSRTERMEIREMKKNEKGKFQWTINKKEVTHASGTGNSPKALPVTI